MARKKSSFVALFIFLCFQIIPSYSSKLNVPRVLLPIFNDFSTNFTLEATEGGCYKWTTSRVDLVQLIPIDTDNYQECSSRVIVSTISKEQTRNTAIVLAEEIHTGQILRCDVIIDVIYSLHIVTTTRELFMEEAPEAFEVRARDDQGNEFTTLEGIRFDWKISSGGNSDSSVLRFISFRDSPYETPSAVQTFDEMGIQGHIILLEGVKTGSAKVSVRLPYPEYKHVQTIEVSLMVIANLLIEPVDVYILRGDVIHFKIIQVKHGRLEEINLPSSQYYLVTENPQIGFIDKNSGYLTGMETGKTRVHLHDRNVYKNDTGLKLPSATVYVTFPDRITLSLQPYRNWAVLVQDTFNLVAELYSSNDHKIHLGEGVRLMTTFDTKLLKSLNRSYNGSWIIGQAMEPGVAKVETTLTSVISNRLGTIDLHPKLSTQAEIHIFPKIVLDPSEVILPWDPVVKPKYDIEIKATGGDGKFSWSTTNHSLGTVTQGGHVRTHFHGFFETCASMARNNRNKQCAKFYIIPPSKLEIIDHIMEGELGSPIFLHVALYGQRPNLGNPIEIPYTKCGQLPFTVTPSDNIFFYNKSATIEPLPKACATVAVVGTDVGTARITISYTRDNLHLENIVSVSAYRPLRILHPASKETVLALGTSRYLKFVGGPRPWIGRPFEHLSKLQLSNRVTVKALDMTQKFKVPGELDTYIVHVTCLDIGETNVRLTVSNKPYSPIYPSIESTAYVNVICEHPKFIYLQPEIKVADTASCPMDLSSERVVVQSYRKIDLQVTVKDEQGRKFDNISSLEFRWKLNPLDLGTVSNKNGVYEGTLTDINIILPHKNYQIITPESRTGIITVETEVLNYHTSILKQQRVVSIPSVNLGTMITLYLVDDTIVIPNKTSIYNHRLNKLYLSVKQGSGYYSLIYSPDNLAEVKYNDGTREIEITPKQTGEIRISLSDLCLISNPVNIVVNIVYVASIRIEMSDRVEIGKSISAVVKFYDEFDNLMPLPKLDYLDVRFSMSKDIITTKMQIENPENPWGVGEIHYTVTGVELGDSKLVFLAGRGNKEVQSNAVNVQVFAPLRIYPRNTTLVIGAVLQLTTQGGPQPDTNIEYMVETANVAEMSNTGLVQALNLGHTRVTGQSISIHPATGQKIVNSEDAIDVYVIPLIGIKISAPLTRFLQGTTVPVWASGVPEQLSPLILGSVQPSFHFSWGHHCSDIILTHGILHSVGVRDDTRNQISIRVSGLKSGHCMLELNVTVPGVVTGSSKRQVVYRATIDMEVFEELQLVSPHGVSGRSILIAPYTELQLKTNKDGLNVLSYSLHDDTEEDINKSVSLINPILSLSKTGLVKTFGTTGRTMIIITAIDEHGLKQTLTIVLQIKSVHYMMLTMQSNWLVPIEDSVNALPLGTEFQLVVTFHDNTGRKFAAANCNLYFRTSRFDLLEIKRGIDNESLQIASVKEGPTVLKVWTEDCQKITDYVQLLGKQMLKPSLDVITHGDIICMWSPVVDSQRAPGKWSSEPLEAISVNTSTGIAQIISPRSTEAHIKYDLTPASTLTFKVEPVSEIFIFENIPSITNTWDISFKILFVLKSTQNMKKRNNLFLGWQCQHLLNDDIIFPFSCTIAYTNSSISPSIWNIFDVRPTFNKENGYYACEIFPISEVTEASSAIESNVTLTVISDDVVSHPLELEFLPAVFVSSREIYLSNKHFSATLSIHGLPRVLKQVSVVPYDSSLLHVTKVQHLTPNIDSYTITLIDYHWKLGELQDPMTVIVTSKSTQQNIKVHVKLNNGKTMKPFCPVTYTGSPITSFFYENSQILLIIGSTALLYFTYYVYSTYMQPNIIMNTSANPSFYGDISQRILSPTSSMSSGLTGCSPSNYINRSLDNSISPLRYGDAGETSYRDPTGHSPELRRNRRFL